MNIFIYFKKILFDIAQITHPKAIKRNQIKVEFPNHLKHGDLSSNIAIIIAQKINRSFSYAANKILKLAINHQYVNQIIIIKSGFINIKIKKIFWHTFLNKMLFYNNKYPLINLGNNKKINIEFVSANPTGPLHIGHARGAILGDAISNVFLKCGYNTTKDFYINDAGNQIKLLINSLKIRYRQLLGQNIALEKNCYPGQYLIAFAIKLLFISKSKVNDNYFLNSFIVEEMLKIIKNELYDINIYHNNFISEYQLILQKKVNHCINFLKKKQLLYEGILQQPKSKLYKTIVKKQILFKSTNSNDDIDRVLIKHNGEYTYFLSDIVYHLDKVNRGFNNIILLLGADHIGYKKRIIHIVNALTNNKAKINVKICQLVKLLQKKKQVKMSKRLGTFVTLQKILNEIDKDALKFEMLSKKSNTILEINIDKLKQQSKNNPVFYIQYASARANSIFSKAKELDIDIKNISKLKLNISLLNNSSDISLIKMLSLYPKILTSCLHDLELHKITYYLYNLACIFHKTWSNGGEGKRCKFIDGSNNKLTKERVYLVYGIQLVISAGLNILGIKPIIEMN